MSRYVDTSLLYTADTPNEYYDLFQHALNDYNTSLDNAAELRRQILDKHTIFHRMRNFVLDARSGFLFSYVCTFKIIVMYFEYVLISDLCSLLVRGATRSSSGFNVLTTLVRTSRLIWMHKTDSCLHLVIK